MARLPALRAGLSSLALLLVVGAQACSGGAPAALSSRTLKACGEEFEYRVFAKSLPGRFFITPYWNAQSCLAALTTEGEVLFQRRFTQRRFSGRFPVTMLTDFKPVAPGLYGYFVQHASDEIHVSSTYHFLDSRFRDVFPRAVPDADPDLNSHDVQLTSRGTLFFVFYRPRQTATGPVIAAEIEEWGPGGPTGFRWSSMDWPQTAPEAHAFPDYLHMNSLEIDADGGLLLSFLTRSEVIKISYPEGRILWRLSSKDWTFRGDPLHGFHFQHSARRLPNGNLLLYDNGAQERGGVSRAVEYRLDVKARVAELVWEYRNLPGNPFRERLGSVQRLSNGNTLICWGNTLEAVGWRRWLRPVYPLFTEVDSTGKVVRELLGRPYRSYRAAFEESGH